MDLGKSPLHGGYNSICATATLDLCSLLINTNLSPGLRHLKNPDHISLGNGNTAACIGIASHAMQEDRTSFAVYAFPVVVCKHAVIVVGNIIDQMLAAAGVRILADINKLVIMRFVAAPVQIIVDLCIGHPRAGIIPDTETAGEIEGSGGSSSIALPGFIDPVSANIADTGDNLLPAAAGLAVHHDLSPGTAQMLHKYQLVCGRVVSVLRQKLIPFILTFPCDAIAVKKVGSAADGHSGVPVHGAVGSEIIVVSFVGKPSGSHHAVLGIKITGVVFGIREPSFCHNAGFFGKIAQLSLGVGEPAARHDSLLAGKVAQLSLGITKPSGGHDAATLGKIAHLSFGIGHPSGGHDAAAFCKIAILSLFVFRPAFQLCTVLHGKIVAIFSESEPALMPDAVFVIVGFSVCGLKAIDGCLYLCGGIDCHTAAAHQQGQKKRLQTLIESVFFHTRSFEKKLKCCNRGNIRPLNLVFLLYHM